MKLTVISGRGPPKPDPDIVALLRELLTRAEAGEVCGIAVTWADSKDEYESAAFCPDQSAMGARVYALAHDLLMEDFE